MAGKQSPGVSRSKPPVLVFVVALVALSLVFFLFSWRNPNQFPEPINSNPITYKPQTSFVASLDQFLLTHKRNHPPDPDDTFRAEKELDDLIWKSQSRRLYGGDPYYPVSLPIKVYVYNMPSKFTYDLLWLFQNTYKDTSNLTSNGSPVHRLIEQVFFFS